MCVPGLLERRLIFVTGKGGVGKSTVATALGVMAARRGLRTIVAELASQARVRETFERSGETFEEVQLGERLFTISIDPERAMEEYLRVKTGAIGQRLGSSRLFHAFAMATPGMRELLSIGKVWELAQLERRTRGADSYDLVIVDSPAAGHGVGILRTPRTFAEIARVGPIAHQGRVIARTIADRAFTAVVAVATGEEMPVNETLWLQNELADEGLPLDAVIANAVYPDRFRPSDRRKLTAARRGASSALLGAALGAALSEQDRAARQREQLARLAAGLGSALVELPYLFTEELGPDELERLADGLEAGLAESEPAGVTR
jgi:anion-transporting  ArsA/GET3 family ATPase